MVPICIQSYSCHTIYYFHLLPSSYFLQIELGNKSQYFNFIPKIKSAKYEISQCLFNPHSDLKFIIPAISTLFPSRSSRAQLKHNYEIRLYFKITSRHRDIVLARSCKDRSPPASSVITPKRWRRRCSSSRSCKIRWLSLVIIYQKEIADPHPFWNSKLFHVPHRKWKVAPTVDVNMADKHQNNSFPLRYNVR